MSIQSPKSSHKIFERAIASTAQNMEISEEDESDDDDLSESSSDDDGEGRPMSVQAMRKEAAESMRPGTAMHSPEQIPSPLARRTVI
jgi:hypothetical protein